MPKLVQPIATAPAVRAKKNPLAWGRKLTFDPNAPLNSQARVNWQEGAPLVVLQNPDLRQGRIAPLVQNIVLQLSGFYAGMQDSVFRWLIDFGAGGARSLIKINANGVQQISLSAEMLTVSLISDNWGANWPTPWAAPTQAVQASVFYADGSTTTQAPTYTERFFISAASPAVTLAAPNGAVGWRITGQPGAVATSPFIANVNYFVQPISAGFPLDEWDGTALEPIRNQVIPFPASAANILVSSPGVDIAGGIEWTIDL